MVDSVIIGVAIVYLIIMLFLALRNNILASGH